MAGPPSMAKGQACERGFAAWTMDGVERSSPCCLSAIRSGRLSNVNRKESSPFPPLGRIRETAGTLGREENYRLIVLFGSVARGESHPEDLDIAVLGRGAVDTIALTTRFIQLLGVQEVDVCDLRRADPLLMALVARDGIPLYEETPGEFARFASLAARRFADTRKFREMERREIQDILTTQGEGT
jgi:predicted nucleotidyltransferase